MRPATRAPCQSGVSASESSSRRGTVSSVMEFGAPLSHEVDSLPNGLELPVTNESGRIERRPPTHARVRPDSKAEVGRELLLGNRDVLGRRGGFGVDAAVVEPFRDLADPLGPIG